MTVQEKARLLTIRAEKKMPFYPGTWVKREKKAVNSHLSSKPLVISEGKRMSTEICVPNAIRIHRLVPPLDYRVPGILGRGRSDQFPGNIFLASGRTLRRGSG